MSNTSEVLRRVARSTREDIRESGKPAARSFLDNLQEASTDIGLPIEGEVGERIAFSLLNREAPFAQRHKALSDALATSKNVLLTRLLPTVGIDGAAIADRARTISDQLAASVVESAATYPKKPKKKDTRQEILKIFNPTQPTQEDRAISACVIYELFQPYLVDRLLELDLYDPDKLKVQMQGITRDASLVRSFYRSTAHAIEFAVDGKSSIPFEEVTERMFQIGPIFAKSAQGLNIPDMLADKLPDQEKAEFITQVSKGMQEGIAPPTEIQQLDIAESLPEGLSYTKIISSASIAHVVEAQTDHDETRATKVKRPNIEQAIKDNEDTYNLMTRIVARFFDEHTRGTALGNRVQQVTDAFEFILGTYVTDLKQELDFIQEAAAQKKGEVIFERHKGIHVPKIDEGLTDAEHITMEYMPGERLEDLPAHPEHLKNLAITLIEMWKSRFLHGDLHGGNVKGRGDGSLILYDWGKSIALTPDFIKNMGKFLYAISRKNPDAIAKSYVKIQSPDQEQITVDKAKIVAKEVVDSLTESEDQKRTWMKRKQHDVSKTITGLTIAMALRQQSSMDMHYGTALQTTVRFGTVIAKELEKPEYKNKRFKRKVLRYSILGAIRDVYFPKKEDKQK